MPRLLVIYHLYPGVDPDAFEAALIRNLEVAPGRMTPVERFARITGEGGEGLDFVEVYPIQDPDRFNPEDLPPHVQLCMAGEYEGVESPPSFKVTPDPT